MLAAGHRPLLPIAVVQARAVLRQVVGGCPPTSRNAIDAGLRRQPDGVTIDDLATDLAATAEPSYDRHVALAWQFQMGSTYYKLSLRDHCLPDELQQGRHTSRSTHVQSS